MHKKSKHVKSEANEKKQKPLVVTVAHTVVYEHTVVVEFLDTSVTKITVLCIFRSQGLTRYAYVIQMIILADKLCK